MNEHSCKALWDQSLFALKQELDTDEYNLWFAKVEYLRCHESVIYAAVPTAFFLDVFKPRLPKLTNKLSELAGVPITINLEVSKNPPKAPAPKESAPVSEAAKDDKAAKAAKDQPEDGKSAAHAPRTKGSHFQLLDEYSFDTYVVKEINSYAYNAALSVAKNPGNKSIYNPLLIYGGTGLGKTHLMQAIGQYIHQHSDLKILYITGEGFLREFVETVATAHKNKDLFAKKYRNVDVLLIDDVHTIERGLGIQDELFYTFEALWNQRKQMIFTCDRPLAELKNMLPRLKTRLGKGIQVELQLPGFEELLIILRQKMKVKQKELQKEIIVSDEIIEMLIKNISTNIRDMEGALNKLMGYADLVNKPVTIEIAQRELRDMFADPKQGNISIEIIQKLVAEEFNLSLHDLKGKKRSKGIVMPRHISMYLCRELTDYSQGEIGDAFGRDHSTVIHSCKTIENELIANPNFYTTLEKLKKLIKERTVN